MYMRGECWFSGRVTMQFIIQASKVFSNSKCQQKTIHSSAALKRIKCFPLLFPTPKLPNGLIQREGLMFQRLGLQHSTVWENNSITKFVVKRRMPQPTTRRIWKAWSDNFISIHMSVTVISSNRYLTYTDRSEYCKNTEWWQATINNQETVKRLDSQMPLVKVMLGNNDDCSVPDFNIWK